MASLDDGLYRNEGGVIRSKKTYFCILAHTNEQALAVQIQNVRHFNPGAGIIVYNGGTNPDFARDFNVLLYPGSHPIRHGNLTPYFWEIMKWLETNCVEYEFLINLDHDVLFIKHGFQDYLDKLMENADVMGWDMVTSFSPADTNLSCCQDMWKEWDTWGPFFETEYFIRYLNPTQVYRHSIVRKMLETTDHQVVEKMIADPRVFALEEMFFVTLALSAGGRIREYPREDNWRSVSRFGHEQISMDEVRLIKQHPYYYWIHPVKEDWLIRMNRWLMGAQDEEIHAVEPAPLPPEAPPSAIAAPIPVPPPSLITKKVIPFRRKKQTRIKKLVQARKKAPRSFKKKSVKHKIKVKEKKRPAKHTNRPFIQKRLEATTANSQPKKRIWRIPEVEIKP